MYIEIYAYYLLWAVHLRDVLIPPKPTILMIKVSKCIDEISGWPFFLSIIYNKCNSMLQYVDLTDS